MSGKAVTEYKYKFTTARMLGSAQSIQFKEFKFNSITVCSGVFFFFKYSKMM
jgi:hypothetical protein